SGEWLVARFLVDPQTRPSRTLKEMLKMSDYDLVLKNGLVVMGEAVVAADVGVMGGKIAGIAHHLHGTEEIDCQGHIVTPGAVDVHVHLQYPIGPLTTGDDFFTGTRAAALGGTTTIIDFVEARPQQPLLDALHERHMLAAERAVIDYGFHMTITPTDIPKLDQVPAVVAAGCPSFKHYMAYSFRLHDGELLQSFQAIRRAGGLPIVHAENWDVIQALVRQNLAAGRTEPRWHPRSRPALMEGEAAGRVINLAALAETPVYIFHVSCQAVVERIAAARAQGQPVYGETCPQYLLLDDSLFEQPGVAGALPICSPPLRPRSEQAHLWAALARGDLQVISTDHCPFWLADKAAALEDFSRIPGGVPSIESRFALAYTFGVGAGRLSLSQWVARCCTTPAQLMGLTHKGQIAVGYDADLVVFDPQWPVTLSTETLHENVDWTLYAGRQLTGWPRHTLSRGRWLVRDGAFVGRPGQGQFVCRHF
ncbi:MAG: dihydropyrimidinase, partial [Anaerolineales bacterium]|nr:dihydropyrimidinase [Anaerolineales bacterium]